MAEKTKAVETVTPSALAEKLGVDPKRLRAYLRANHARPIEAKNTSWMIPADVAKAATEYFAAKSAPSDEDEA